MSATSKVNRASVSLSAAFGEFVFWVTAGVLVFALHGYCAQQLWAWFVAPLFALPLLTFWQAWGLAITWRSFAGRSSQGGRDDDKWSRLAVGLIGPCLSLAAGWVVRFWVMP